MKKVMPKKITRRILRRVIFPQSCNGIRDNPRGIIGERRTDVGDVDARGQHAEGFDSCINFVAQGARFFLCALDVR